MMSERPQADGFLSRWSRMKTEARESDARPPVEPIVPIAAARPEEDLPPELPPVESLTIDSDFTGFLHPKVDEGLRRSALRKLFSDPHFNVMDGLDVYIDDYSVSEPIPPEMLAGLKQAQRILRWAEGKDDEETPEERADSEAQPPLPDGAIAPESPPDDIQVPVVEEADPVAQSVVAKPD